MLKNLCKKTKSFTLIELLVVIFIIGLLATISLTVTTSARYKARDSKIITDFNQIRQIAEWIQNTYDSYNQLCAADGTLNETAPDPYGTQLGIIESDIQTQQGGTLNLTCRTGVNTTGQVSYCVSASLIFTTGSFFCVDSTGMAGVYSTNNCDGTNYDCAP